MLIKIFQANKDKFIKNQIDFIQGNHEPLNRQDYILAATVEANDIDEAFALSQNIDRSWVEDKRVVSAANRAGMRSTSIGDIVELDEKYFVCCPTGWKEIEF